jgi:ATP-binding cassette subfamily F protein 3
VLLLDEPTNHLDVAAVEWLEEFLTTYPSAYIIVSHDRYFLDRTSTRIIEVELGRASSYTGNYSAYLVEREVRREAQQRAFENQQHLIAKTEEFIRRNLAGQKTKQAKSRRKMLEKLERVEGVRPDQSSGDFRLKAVERAGNQVLTVEDASVGYPGKVLATGITFTLRRGEALGIIGPNGSGKTTFIKTVLGKLPVLAGEVKWGTKVEVGYYAQQLDDLDERNEIIMELRRVAPSTVTAGELRGFLAKFLFTGDDVYKHVRDLSGGEKGRLALAKLIYSRANVLILDEPTNHLDIPSREALEEALDAYQGTIITISHDRYFLDRVATQILALDGDSNAEHYDGDYTEYHDWKAQKKSASLEAAKKEYAEQQVKKSASTSTQSSVKKKEKKREPERDAQRVEAEISEAEKRLAVLSEEMGKPEVAREPGRLAALNQEYRQTEESLQALYQEWERVAAETTKA